MPPSKMILICHIHVKVVYVLRVWHLSSGKVEMEVSDGLSDEEIDDGYILCCQALPTSDNVEIEVD